MLTGEEMIMKFAVKKIMLHGKIQKKVLFNMKKNMEMKILMQFSVN